MTKRRKQKSFHASASPSERVIHGWEWAHAALWNEGKKCGVRMSDTIVFYRDAERGDIDSYLWLFTGKSGTISRKRMPKDGAIPVAKIRERFLQLAGRASEWIAVVNFLDGTRKLVGLEEFEEVLQALDSGKRGASSLSKKVEGLQAFILPSGGEASHIQVDFEVSSTLPDIRIEHQAGYLNDRTTPIQSALRPLSTSAFKEVENATSTVVSFLSRTGDAQIAAATLEFVYDGSQTLWLTHIGHVELQEPAVAPSLLQKKTSLPNLQATNAAKSDISAAKCRGEFCQVPLTSLPGLLKLIEATRKQRDSNNLDDGHLDQPVLEDTGQRYKMGNNNLLLAHAEIDVLEDTSKLSSSQMDNAAFALQWQEADNVFRTEIGRSNPAQFYKQVFVCANCHRVYSEINKLRDVGFQGPRSVQERPAADMESAVETRSHGDEDDSSDPYDKLFLEELARQSAAIDRNAQENSRHVSDGSKKRSPNGPEQDDSLGRPTSGLGSSRERPVLPSLQSTLPDPKLKKKTGHSDHGSVATDGRSNQHSPATLQPPQATGEDRHLAERVASLETELSQTKHKLAGVEARRNKLEQEVLHTRTQCTAMLREKDDQARKQLLELEFNFHSKQSKVKQTASDSSSADEITRLIETIDSLNLQLDQANRDKEQAKKLVALTHQAELKKLHEKYQLDMETLRLSEHSAKEQTENLQMQMLSLQSQAQVATTQAKNAKAALEDLANNKVVGLEEKSQRLERQLAALKLQQRNQGQSPVGSVNLVASASVAKQNVEAMEKHLNNKIEYLKAQLASEMKCKEELGSHLAQITNAMEQMKIDKRQALAEQEEVFKKQAERIESAFSQEKELLATQQAAMQGKLVTLQANVTDLVQELTMWKSREANAKLAMEKTVEENVRLTRQLVDAEGQVEALQEERKQDTAKVGSMSVMNASEETKRVQMEALLRRLDNERQYLKSQLEGQQEMKETSQKQVTDLQYEIQELKDAMEEALQVSGQKISALVSDKRHQEQELRGTIECLEEGKLLLSRQLKEVHTKFAEAREQSLVERDEIDKSRIEVSEMRAQLLAAKEDSVKEQAYAKSSSERMSKSLTAVKNSLKAMEEEKTVQIRRLEAENAEYMGKLATTQGEMLVLEEKLEKENVRAKKEKALAMFAMVLSGKVALWRLRSQHRAFAHAKLQTNLTRLQANQEKRRAEELGRLEERLREGYMAKCDEMTQTLHDERLEAIRQTKEQHDKDREELNEFYQQEKSQLQEDLAATYAAQMQQMKDKLESLSKAVEESAATTIQALQEQVLQLQQDNTRLAVEMAEMTQKSEEMACTFEDELGALKADWEGKQACWNSDEAALRAEIHAQRDRFEEQLSSETSNLVVDHARELAVIQALHDADTSERDTQFTARLTMLSEEQSQQFAGFRSVELAAMTQKHQHELEEAITSVAQRWQKEMDYQRQAHEKALQDAVVTAELKANAQLASLQKEMNERKGAAVVQCTSKWQRAMEELQDRQEVDKKMAYNEGLQDREKEWQQAALQIKERQREELDKVQQEAIAAIRAAEERHEMRFQAQLAGLQTQLEEQHSQSLQALTDEITTRERERAQEHYDASADVIEQELNAKWTQNLDEQRIHFENQFVEEKARLVSTMLDEKEAVLQQLREDHDNNCAELEKAWALKLDEFAASTATAREQELESVREEFDNEKEALTKQLQDTFSNQLEEQLSDQEARLLREQEDAIAQVQEDSEKLIEQVERAMAELKRQKEHLEAELLSLRSALEETEDAQFDAQESFKKQQKQAAFHILHLVLRAQKKITEEVQSHHNSRANMETKCSRLQTELTDEKSRWEDLMTRVHEIWSQVQTQHGEMTQTLTNYKRDELVAHRSSSAVLSNEISIVTKQLEEVEEMKLTLERDVETLQSEAQTIETSLRDLMMQPNSNGPLNMAVIAKKRRLNEEFEALLERIEKKKAEIRTVDQTLGALRARREEKEQEMRAMERKLVEILVQQQKRMLLLVSAVREVSLPTIAS